MDLDLHEALYKTNYTKVFKAVFKILGSDYYLIQDVVQEAFLKGFQNLHQLKEKDKFCAWITAIATNSAIDELRKQKRQLPKHGLNTEVQIEEIAVSICVLPENIYERKEFQKELLDAISQLDIYFRQTVYLKYYFDLSDKEIASFLNIKEGTVRSRLTRARQTLKLILNEKSTSRKVATDFER